MIRKDILNTEIKISDADHIEGIVLSAPGDFKFSPAVGFNGVRYVKSNVAKSQFVRNLRQQIDYDGYKDYNIDLSAGIESLKINM